MSGMGTSNEIVQADARNRALRVFLVGLGIDLLVATGVTVGAIALDPNFAWSGAYWAVVGTTFTKTVMQTIGSYLLRLKVAPSPATRGTNQ